MFLCYVSPAVTYTMFPEADSRTWTISRASLLEPTTRIDLGEAYEAIYLKGILDGPLPTVDVIFASTLCEYGMRSEDRSTGVKGISWGTLRWGWVSLYHNWQTELYQAYSLPKHRIDFSPFGWRRISNLMLGTQDAVRELNPSRKPASSKIVLV